ncbi:hypothetical protein D9619_003821 [Psilocybe cf. subviscida]|uniref:BTB domain-containing protein n=1 Tax=Psilocybe cf. subviscida TaxID=2480587 RepID=A0A8H5ETW1_9AGAR|nr:hypothetical protein D9619_003821 [Psilocybe cf. subviscida]
MSIDIPRKHQVHDPSIVLTRSHPSSSSFTTPYPRGPKHTVDPPVMMATEWATPTKVPDLWFEDGNVILIAEDRAFRLYKGVLASRSPVLKEMLNTSQPPTPMNASTRGYQDGSSSVFHRPETGEDVKHVFSAVDVIDVVGIDTTGCAVVRFTDKPQEMEWFLSVLLGNSLTSQFAVNMPILAGVLRLATKYRVNFLREWAVESLEQLTGFTADPNPDDILMLSGRVEGKPTNWMDGMFLLVDVANTVGVPWILPYVLWMLQGENASLAEILHHPEWDEFPEPQKKQFLLAREYGHQGGYSEFAFVLALYQNGGKHSVTDEGEDCREAFNKGWMDFIGQYGPLAKAEGVWGSYVETRGCSECRQTYAAQRRDMIVGPFLACMRQNGLPEHAEMMDMRAEFYQEVAAMDRSEVPGMPRRGLLARAIRWYSSTLTTGIAITGLR